MERQFGRFTLLAKLGWGGMADVYLATEEDGRDKPIVVKRLKPDLVYDAEYRAMFEDEARLALRLDHPNIVRAFESGDVDGQPFLTMELLDGQPLSALASQSHSLARGEILRIVRELLEGLHYAHELRDETGAPLEIVHRDVSPHNVFVTHDGRVKLVDFGVAKSRLKAQHTSTGVVKGKIGYMAPEQALANAVDRRADVFSVGVILWELIAQKPFWGDKPDVQILKAMTFGELPPTNVSPPELASALGNALTVTPDRRYESAAAFRDAIDALLVALGGSPAPMETRAPNAAPASDRRRAIEAVLRADRGGLPSKGASTVDGQALPVAPGATEPPRSRVPLGVAAVLGIAAVVALGARELTSRPARAETSLANAKEPAVALVPIESTPASTTASAPTIGDTVSVRVTTAPRDAVVTLDGSRLADDPFSARFARDGAPHRLTFEARGYEPRAELIVFDRDIDLDVALVAQHGARARNAPLIAPSTASARPHGVDERDPWSSLRPKP